MYQIETRIGYSQLDSSGVLSPVSVINLFQDCSNFQSMSIGEDVSFYKSIHRAWILSSWQIIYEGFPGMGTEVIVSTAAYDFNAMFGMRNFLITTKSGEVIAKANSNWVFLDADSKKPVRITEEISKPYYTGDKPLDMDYAPRKVSVPKELSEGESFRVMRCHLDTNGHVNNSYYIEFALEYVPEDFVIGQIRTEYKLAAIYGDVIKPCYNMTEDKITVVLKNDKDGGVFAVVEIERRKH